MWKIILFFGLTFIFSIFGCASKKGVLKREEIKREQAIETKKTKEDLSSTTPKVVVEFKKTIAVLNFVNNSPNKNWNYMESGVAEILSTNLSNYSEFNVVERENLEKVLKEQSLIMSGVVDLQTAAQIGKILGANIIILGSITQLGKTIVVSAKLVDVETAQVLSGQMVNGEKEEELNNIVMSLVEKIVASLK